MKIWEELSLGLRTNICRKRRIPKPYNYQKNKQIMNDFRFIVRNGKDSMNCINVEKEYFFFKDKMNLRSVCMVKEPSDLLKSMEAEEANEELKKTLKMTKIMNMEYDVYTQMNVALESITTLMRDARIKCQAAMEKLLAEQAEDAAAKAIKQSEKEKEKSSRGDAANLDREIKDLEVFYNYILNIPMDEAAAKELQENTQFIVYVDGIIERLLKQRVKLTTAPAKLETYREYFGNWTRKLKSVRPNTFTFGLQETQLQGKTIKKLKNYDLEMIKKIIGPQSPC